MSNALENDWVIWKQLPSIKNDAETYLSGMEEICKFGSVEAFWKCYLNLPPVKYYFNIKILEISFIWMEIIKRK